MLLVNWFWPFKLLAYVDFIIFPLSFTFLSVISFRVWETCRFRSFVSSRYCRIIYTNWITCVHDILDRKLNYQSGKVTVPSLSFWNLDCPHLNEISISLKAGVIMRVGALLFMANPSWDWQLRRGVGRKICVKSYHMESRQSVKGTGRDKEHSYNLVGPWWIRTGWRVSGWKRGARSGLGMVIRTPR